MRHRYRFIGWRPGCRCLLGLVTIIDAAGVKRKSPLLTVLEKKPEGHLDRAKSELVPGNVRLVKQGHLQAFGARRKIEVIKLGTKYHIDLIDMRQADNRVKILNTQVGIGLLARFALSRLLQGLIILHEARRQGPETIAGLDGPFAEQNLVLPHR